MNLSQLESIRAARLQLLDHGDTQAASLLDWAVTAEPEVEVEHDEKDYAPTNSLPDWDECALRVANSDFIAKRVAEGGYGAEPDSKLATQLHRFIYEYDDADPFRSSWFLHRLELLVNELRGQALT